MKRTVLFLCRYVHVIIYVPTMSLWYVVHTRDMKWSTRGTFFVCVTFPLCRYVASVNQALLNPPSYLIKSKSLREQNRSQQRFCQIQQKALSFLSGKESSACQADMKGSVDVHRPSRENFLELLVSLVSLVHDIRDPLPCGSSGSTLLTNKAESPHHQGRSYLYAHTHVRTWKYRKLKE